MKELRTSLESMWSIQKRIESGKLRIPAHQKGRGNVWPGAKKKKWKEDIEELYAKSGGEAQVIPGMITTYILKGDDEDACYSLNDGANRMYWTLGEIVSQWKAEGRNVQDILICVRIAEQRVKYENIGEALEHFWKIQWGTTCTPFEMLYGMFVERLDEFETVWEPQLTKMHNIVDSALKRLGCKVPDKTDVNKRPTIHKNYRDDFSLFYKYLSEDASKTSYRVAATNVNCDAWERETKLEVGLIELMKKKGIEEIKKAIANFEKYVDEYTALYQTIWSECEMDKGATCTGVNFRWWLLVSIYKRNNNFNNKAFRKFTEKLIKNTGGKSTIFYKDRKGRNKNTNTALSKLTNLTTALKGVGMTVEEFETVETREKENQPLKPGFVNSHLLAFCVHGNGATVPENAIDNRERGNRDID